jgi:hypothetical protein
VKGEEEKRKRRRRKEEGNEKRRDVEDVEGRIEGSTRRRG